MKNKSIFFLIAFIVCGVVAGNGAEPSADSKPAAIPNQLPEALAQTLQLQTKIGEARALLSEIQDLLKQEDKILAETRGQNEQAKKSEASLAEYNHAADVIRQEIQKLRDKVTEAEKELAAQTKQAERYNNDQAEFTKAQKERSDSEAKARQAEDKLVAAQKNLAELKDKFAETKRQINSLKNRSLELENSAAVLKMERTRREEASARAEKSAVMAEKAEKERLLLANRLAELERGLSTRQANSQEQAGIEKEVEKEKKAVRETEEKIRKAEKSREEAEKAILKLKKQLQALQAPARESAQKEDNPKHLQARLDKIRNQRIAAEEQLKKTEEMVKESEESMAPLTNMIAVAESQQEKDRATAQAIAALENEHAKETALLNEITARIDRQNSKRKALEDEKIRLNQNLILVKEKLGREEQKISRLDETKLQLAEQKKARADMENKLQQAAPALDALEKEKEQLNQALIEAGNLILKNEKDSLETGLIAGELQKEKELSRKAADLLREKEQSVKQLADEKTNFQGKLNEAKAKLAQQKERAKELEEKRRALEEEKKAKLAAEKQYRELAQAEKEHKKQIKELKEDTRDATRESESIASREVADKKLIVAQAGSDEIRDAKNMAGSSGKDALAVEQDILNQARSGGVQPSGEDAGVDQSKVKKTAKQTGSRSRQNQIAQAERHYELGIQKWDENDLDGAIAEFKNVIRLNPDAAGAYYNISLACLQQGKKAEACDYAYKAGECYVKTKNLTQAARMAVLMVKIDQNSPLIPKLRSMIAAAPRR